MALIEAPLRRQAIGLCGSHQFASVPSASSNVDLQGRVLAMMIVAYLSCS